MGNLVLGMFIGVVIFTLGIAFGWALCGEKYDSYKEGVKDGTNNQRK